MTVAELKQALAKLGDDADNKEVRIWLPGSEIYLAGPTGKAPIPFFLKGRVMIEGNLTSDSALARHLAG